MLIYICVQVGALISVLAGLADTILADSQESLNKARQTGKTAS